MITFQVKYMGVMLLLWMTILFNCAKDEITFLRYDPSELLPVDTLNGLTAVGCPDTEYDDWSTSPYVLPFPVGRSYMVDLSHCSGSYHSAGQPDQFAIDFHMSIGELVTAARDGMVVFVEQSGEDGSFPNNLVIVKHSDGTFAQYMHLTFGGALVEVGDRVKAGDEIGISGATGLAGYPHLHFVVTRPGDFKYPYESMPYNFRNTEANERSLVSGQEYLAKPY